VSVPVCDEDSLWTLTSVRPAADNLITLARPSAEAGAVPHIQLAEIQRPHALDKELTADARLPALMAGPAELAGAVTITYSRQVTIQLVAPRHRPSAWIILLSCLAFCLAGCSSSPENSSPGSDSKVPAAAKSSGGMHGVIETDKGAIEIEFLPSDAPKAVENFRLLAERGYYDNLTFHRIVKGFMIQGGDPSGDGTGGESAWGGTFEDEINPNSTLYSDGYRRGLMAMANAGPDTNGSQFFIMQRDYPLPPAYVIFGRVTKGMEVVDALADTPTTVGPDGGMSQPVTPPKIKKVTIRP
jgi:cyclophilin family peptidyl-prolyl cis-trans isomerase